MEPVFKDIGLLTQKATVAGTEKIPVSATEFITPQQIAGLAPSPTDVVKYTEQTLTSPQQMQARKNQGLYYEEEGIIEKTANPYDYLTKNGKVVLFSAYYTPAGSYGQYIKFTDDVITLDTLVSYRNQSDIYTDLSNLRIFTALETASVTIKYIAEVYDDGGQEQIDSVLFYIVEGEFHSSGEDYLTITDPIYGDKDLFDAEQGTYEVASFYSGSYEPEFGYSLVTYKVEGMVPHCIEPKYIKDMYYEETSEGEQTYIRGDNYAGGKISDNPPAQSDIISLDSTPASELYFTTIEHGYTIATSANPQRDQEVVTVYTEDFEGASKGIYFHEVIIFGGTWAEELHWYGTNTTIHQIPAKYLPITKTLDYNSTDEQIPSAKTVYNILGDVETLLSAL